MTIPVRLVCTDINNILLEPEVGFFTASNKKHVGLITKTHPFLKFATNMIPFTNSEFGNKMNQNVEFSGTPERIHNGTDSSLYTFSEPVGSDVTENSIDRANEGIATIVDFSIIDAGDKITIDGTDLIEGTEWSAVTDNETTAGNLANAVTAIAGEAYIGSTHSVAGGLYDVSIVRKDGTSLSTLTTNADVGEMTVETLKSIKVDNMSVNDVFQFAKGSDLTLSNYTAIKFWINVDKDWENNDSVDLYGFDTDLSVEVGNHVSIEDYFDFLGFDTWHQVVIPLTDMGLSSSTTVDAFRFQQASKDGPKAPKFYIDKLQIEQLGTPLEFKVFSNRDQDFHAKKLRFLFADILDGTVTNGTMPGLSYDKILGVGSLATGITVRVVREGVVDVAANINQLSDMLGLGADIILLTDDGANVFIALELEFSEPIILKANSDTTSYISLTINDDLSGLLLFTGSIRGAYEIL